MSGAAPPANSLVVVVIASIVALVGCVAPRVSTPPAATPTAAIAAPDHACGSPDNPGQRRAVAASDAPRRRIYLMRHGDAAYLDAQGQRVANPDIVELTERGHEQARAAAQWFCTMGVRSFDRVITSDLPRAQQTARDMLDTMGLAGIQPQSWPELREMQSGSRESIEEARARIVPALARLRGESWDTALIVVHTLVNQVILSEALTGTDELFGRFEQGNGCINILDVGTAPQDWVVRAVNVCPDTFNYGSRQSLLERLRR
jgi:broad specificity phosphatase PhoE